MVLLLLKIKENTIDFVLMDFDVTSRAKMHFQNSLYHNFFWKPPPFDQVKIIVQAKWSDLGAVHISNLPNGFLLIHCETNEVIQKILFDGM